MQKKQDSKQEGSNNWIVFKGKSKREDVSVNLPNGFDNTELLDVFKEFELELKDGQVEYNKIPLQQNIVEFYVWDPIPLNVKNIIKKQDKEDRELRKEQKLQMTQNSIDEEGEEEGDSVDLNNNNSKNNMSFLQKYLPQSQIPFSQEQSQNNLNNTQDSIDQDDSQDSNLSDQQTDENVQKKFSKFVIEQYFRKGTRKNKLHLNVIYINRDFFSNFESLEELNSYLEINQEQGTRFIRKQHSDKSIPQDCKHMLILEDIQNMSLQNSIKQRMQRGDHGFSKDFMENNKKYQVKEEEKGRLSEKVNNDDLQEWLCNLYLDFKYDVIEVTCQKDGLKALCDCVKQVSEVNSKGNEGQYDPKIERIDVKKAQRLGIKDEQQMNWVNMLKTIYLCSDDKAVSIALIYKSPKDLIQKYMETEVIKQREQLLADINIVPDLKKKIGKAMSEKIYNIFTQNNPQSMVNYNAKTKK